MKELVDKCLVVCRETCFWDVGVVCMGLKVYLGRTHMRVRVKGVPSRGMHQTHFDTGAGLEKMCTPRDSNFVGRGHWGLA